MAMFEVRVSLFMYPDVCGLVGNIKTPLPGSTSELYRPSDRRLLVTLVPTFADRGCVLSA
jgi:hypothetical protein